ncbi:NAD(P)H-quinone oxidoreductase [Labrys sp. KNU-23]|uniref:NAD(P)H-quinone oxidoreductase n=1 Tax=Labrys sp. KNU-23 TaxID=2789216 RepID=UPI0011EFB2F5|nr:NAD(P)H-quinone oxidoreductase [Labrys sp. KNU-23]QEN87693.1 NAD(P)H-quinone oxidoreductase [Labrys sp. KNU-23]
MPDLPATMTAIAISRPGGPEVLVPEERPVPQPGDNEILIRVAAAGVNRPDVLQRAGAYPPPKDASDLPGLEVAGEVVAIGPKAARWKIGDRVAALTPGGGYAPCVVTDAGHALPVPAGLDMVQAAAIPETFFTVWHNVFQRGRLQSGETLLIHGGSSGIGTTAIMLAKAFGATVIVTAGSPEKCATCRELGADVAIDYKAEDWSAAVKQATGGRGPDVILDMVGGSYIAKNYEVAALEGRIINIAFLQGSKVEIDFVRLMTKRLSHMGSTLRAQSVAAKAAIAAAVEEHAWPLLAQGRCRPLIHAVFPLAEAAKAHALMESSTHSGKIVLTV